MLSSTPTSLLDNMSRKLTYIQENSSQQKVKTQSLPDALIGHGLFLMELGHVGYYYHYLFVWVLVSSHSLRISTLLFPRTSYIKKSSHTPHKTNWFILTPIYKLVM